MKKLLMFFAIYFSFGVNSFSEQPFIDGAGSFKMTIPNVKAMEKEVKKMDVAIVKSSVLNARADSTISTLDSLNDALSTPREIRKYKRELKKD